MVNCSHEWLAADAMRAGTIPPCAVGQAPGIHSRHGLVNPKTTAPLVSTSGCRGLLDLGRFLLGDGCAVVDMGWGEVDFVVESFGRPRDEYTNVRAAVELFLVAAAYTSGAVGVESPTIA